MTLTAHYTGFSVSCKGKNKMRPQKPSSMPSSWPFCRRVKANPPRGAAAVIAPVVATVVSGACNGGTVVSVVAVRVTRSPVCAGICAGATVMLSTDILLCRKRHPISEQMLSNRHRAVMPLFFVHAKTPSSFSTFFFIIQFIALLSNILHSGTAQRPPIF